MDGTMGSTATVLVLLGLAAGCMGPSDVEEQGTRKRSGSVHPAVKQKEISTAKSKPEPKPEPPPQPRPEPKRTPQPKPTPKPKPGPEPKSAKAPLPGDGKVPVDARGSVYGLPLEIKIAEIEVPEKLKGPTPLSALKAKKP